MDGGKRITLVEDDEETRRIYRDLLEENGFLCTELGSIAETDSHLEHGDFGDLVLLDLELEDGRAFNLIERIRRRHPLLVLIAVTAHAGDDWLFPAIAAGCTGFVLKTEAVRRLVNAVDEALTGGAPLTGSIARRLLTRFRALPNDERGPLSPRETEVLRELAEGATYQEAADRLKMSLSTMRTHVQRIYGKLGVTTKAEATTLAHRQGWVR